MENKLIQFLLNIYSGLLTILLWILLIVSIPDNGLILLNFNAVGEMWFEFWLMPIIILFILGFGIYILKQE